jgi:hypothetical protein
VRIRAAGRLGDQTCYFKQMIDVRLLYRIQSSVGIALVSDRIGAGSREAVVAGRRCRRRYAG